MQIINGRAAAEEITIRDLLKRVPKRLMRFMARVAGFKQGTRIIFHTVNEGDTSWRVAETQPMMWPMPDDMAQYVRRFAAHQGHYVAILAVNGNKIDWTVSRLGSVER